MKDESLLIKDVMTMVYIFQKDEKPVSEGKRKENKMGATFRSLEIKTSSENILRKRFKEIQDSDRYQYGNDGYSGGWNNVPYLRVTPYKDVKRWTKKQKSEAFEYLSEICEKWESAKAIKTKTGYLIGAWIPE